MHEWINFQVILDLLFRKISVKYKLGLKKTDEEGGIHAYTEILEQRVACWDLDLGGGWGHFSYMR